MKKKMQQWAALCLALALAFCLGLPVWAEEPEAYGITSGQKGKIILKWKAGDTKEKSVTATAYQVIRVDYDYDGDVPKSPEFYWVNEVAGWVTSFHSDYINAADKSVPEKFKGGSVTAEDMKNFAGDMAQAIRRDTITGLVSISAPNTGTGSITFSDLDMGAYLILLEGGTKIYEPVFVSIVPTWDKQNNTWNLNDLEMYVTAKSQALTLRKTVFDNQGQPLRPQDYENGGSACAQVKIGDTVTYMLVADVPAYPADADNTGYQISDNLPEGMTLKKDSVKVYGLAENAPNGAIWEQINEPGNYTLNTVSATRPVDGNQSVTFNLNFTYNAIKNYAKIRVVYTATANENLKTIGQDNNGAGNVNTAYLDYNNNPYGDGSTWETQTGTATVYSYGIMVQKVDKSNSNPLPGAKFTLKKSGESGEISFVGSNGVYRVATAKERGSTTLEVGASGDEKGKLVISGLDVDTTYELTETKAPDGYIKLSAPVTITITDADPNGKVDDGSDSADGTDGYVELKVENGKGFTLPSTGGMGTMLFTAIGTVLMGGGLVLLLLYLRRRNRQE